MPELPSVNEALNEYFKLKSKFEEDNKALKRQIMNNELLSKKEKRAEFLKLMPKCVNCKRPSKKGTLFNTVVHPSDDTSGAFRTLVASCGNIAEPCNLSIQIELGEMEPLDALMSGIRDDIKLYKNKIIDDKNKLLFGLIDTETALDKFDMNKNYVNELTSIYEMYLEHWNTIVDNPERAQELKETLQTSYQKIEEIKECMKKRVELDEVQFSADAAEIYERTLKPLLTKIRHLKYTVNDVYADEYYNVHRLIQRPYTEIDLAVTDHPNKVVAFDVGLQVVAPSRAPSRSKNIDSEEEPDTDTYTDDEDEVAPREKAKASKIVINIPPAPGQEQPQPNPQQQMPAQGRPKEISRDDPVVGRGDEGIVWRIPEYKQLWGKLPAKLKTELKLNMPWMKDFMHKCVNAQAQGGECRLTTPPNLVVPPKVLGNGTHDFGVTVYNTVFNKQPKTVQETYLTLYREDPATKQKDYTMMLNAVNQLVEQELQFGNGRFV